MWELDCEESWAPKNRCFWTMVLEKTLESPLDCKEIQPVHSKGDQSWVFIGRTDAKAETPILWPPHAKSWLIGKDSDAGRGWGQEEKGTTEDEMAGWHHRLDGHEFEWTLGVGDGQGGLACCDSWGRKESDTTEWLNWTELKFEVKNYITSLLTYKVFLNFPLYWFCLFATHLHFINIILQNICMSYLHGRLCGIIWDVNKHNINHICVKIRQNHESPIHKHKPWWIFVGMSKTPVFHLSGKCLEFFFFFLS